MTLVLQEARHAAVGVSHTRKFTCPERSLLQSEITQQALGPRPVPNAAIGDVYETQPQRRRESPSSSRQITYLTAHRVLACGTWLA